MAGAQVTDWTRQRSLYLTHDEFDHYFPATVNPVHRLEAVDLPRKFGYLWKKQQADLSEIAQSYMSGTVRGTGGGSFLGTLGTVGLLGAAACAAYGLGVMTRRASSAGFNASPVAGRASDELRWPFP